MSLVERAKNICLTPKTEWPLIAGESTTPGSLISQYVVPLALIGPIAGFIGGSVFGHSLPLLGTYRVPIIAGLGMAVFVFVMSIVGVLIISFIINALAPNFGGEKNNQQAMKVAAYSYTPAWIAGVFQLIPMLGILAILGALFGLYLLYLGLPRLMKCPEDRAIGYTVVVVVCAIILSIAISAAAGLFANFGMMTPGGMSGSMQRGGTASDVQFDKESPMGKLQDLGKKMEEAGKKMEAAQKSGNQEEQMKAAMEGLGTILGGGKRVDPVAIDQLKPFIPETFAGLPKESSNAERSGMAGIMVAKAEATYGDGAQKSITLEITDTGGASGLVGLAGWASVTGEKETDSTRERTQKVNGRLVHELVSKDDDNNEFSIVLGDRFVVNARGQGVSIDQLKSAVWSLNLAKLEAMKDAGVTK
jgi:hypothetical protein